MRRRRTEDEAGEGDDEGEEAGQQQKSSSLEAKRSDCSSGNRWKPQRCHPLRAHSLVEYNNMNQGIAACIIRLLGQGGIQALLRLGRYWNTLDSHPKQSHLHVLASRDVRPKLSGK